MNLPTEIFGNVVVVHAPEELGGDQTDAFVACIAGLNRPNVVMDLDCTETLDSRGLEAVLEAQTRLHERGGDVKIATTNSMNRKILEITRLDQQLEVFDSVVEAVTAFQ